jgi:alkaline phosphatase D
MNRRAFLARTGATVALTFAANPIIGYPQRFGTNPFTLGVASGDPLPNSVVLWTRLAPDPINGGGMPPGNVSVDWVVATDENMKNVVRRGREVAAADLAHSVHVDVRGLQPSRWYWYQFRVGSALSPVGRTRTAPAYNRPLDRFRFAFASCQHYEHGYYTAYRHMVEEDLDLIVHLGDYIYESGTGTREGLVRKHTGREIVSLTDYRNRYALYREDPHLQRAHALFPWVVTWDDHEVDNNYANDIPEDDQSREAFLERRANAYQAYYEHMPLRRSSLPKGSSMLLYRRLQFGDLAGFSVLDTRQYRTDQPCGDGNKPLCPEALDPAATIMGPAQEKWLMRGLSRSKTRWNVLAQQVMMAKVDRKPGPETMYPMDQWAGYEVARNRLLGFIAERKIANPVVLTGDIHSNWVADLKPDFSREDSPVVGTEFVGTSISSGGDGASRNPTVDAYLPENPHVKFFNGQRGYISCDITPGRWQSYYRVVPSVTEPDSPLKTVATYVVENGKPGAVPG